MSRTTPQQPPEFLNNQREEPLAQGPTLERLRELVATARDLEARKKDLEDAITENSKALNSLYRDKMPTLFDTVGVKSLTLEPQGNNPGVVATLKPFYKASIPAEWPEDQRRKAFNWLDHNGHGDLIKTVVVVTFAREDRTGALECVEALREKNLDCTIKEDVHHATLTAWLKAQVEAGDPPPLDVIGGIVDRIVNLKPTKD